MQDARRRIQDTRFKMQDARCGIQDSGELYLKVVFKGKGGVSTGRLLAAVNRPH